MLRFPDRPCIPTEPAVFDDSSLAVGRCAYRWGVASLLVCIALAAALLGLGL